MNDEKITKIVHEIRGNPKLIENYAECVEKFTVENWLYLLGHCPNAPILVGKCDKWDQIKIDDLCDLLGRHSQLTAYCPDSVLRKFKRGHWARLVASDGSIFSTKLEEFGLADEMKGDWCCVHHWAEDYCTLFRVRNAAASPRPHKVARIAELSAMNRQSEVSTLSFPYRNDPVRHLQWLAAVAQDFSDMAALAASANDVQRAEEYALIAEAASYASTSNGSGCIHSPMEKHEK